MSLAFEATPPDNAGGASQGDIHVEKALARPNTPAAAGLRLSKGLDVMAHDEA